MKLPVDDDGIRPAGKPDRCFYCNAPKGSHRDDCVCLKRTVVMEMRIQFITEVPQSWSVDDIEFSRNESTRCQGNDIDQLHDENNREEGSCFTCHRAKQVFVREATDEDHAHLLPPKAEE